MAPCRCRGSMRGVHASCIESWIAARTRQRLRPELQGGDHVQPQICCDLCGEPYQAEHHPAHLCDCLKAHMRECLEQLQDELGTLGLRRVCGIVLGNCWLTCVMMGSAILVSDILKEACLGTRPWQCWLAAVLYAAFLATLMYESTVILVSFPWTDTPPTSCLRYFFLPGNQVTQVAILLMWAHLWSVATISSLACALVSYTNAHLPRGQSARAGCSWTFLGLLFVPAILPHLKHCLVTMRGCSWQRASSMWQNLRQDLRRCCAACNALAARHNRESILVLLRLILNPSLPWLQILLVFPFGVAWFSPSAPTPRYIVIGTCAGIGCPSAVYAWLQLCCKRPMHPDYICPMEASVRMHLGWFGALSFLLYSALSVYAQERWLSEHSKKDSVKANAAVFLVWGVWTLLVLTYAIYANGSVMIAYSQQWRRRHGRLRIGGEEINS